MQTIPNWSKGSLVLKVTGWNNLKGDTMPQKKTDFFNFTVMSMGELGLCVTQFSERECHGRSEIDAYTPVYAVVTPSVLLD